MGRPITSREYKLMLNVDRFADPARGAAELWNVTKFILAKLEGKVVEEQQEEDERRTWYLDTDGAVLRSRGLTLRVRDEGKKHKVTLKLRAADRYVAAAADLTTTADKAEWKFEEDILPPFASRFAHSVSVGTKSLPPLATIADLATLFPKAPPALPAGTPLEVVNGFRAHEVARKLAKVSFEESTTVKLALSFWYLRGERGEYPVVGELSFDYDVVDGAARGAETFPERVVSGASAFFAALQRQSGWFDLSGTTKTAAAYDAF